MPSATPTHSGPPDPPSSTLAVVDLDALAHNLRYLRRCIPDSCEILAVVKADAYGHGAVRVTQALRTLGVHRFGVATLEEGLTLRRAGIEEPVLVMGALLPEQCADAVAHGLTPIVHHPDIADHLAKAVPAAFAPYPVHLKHETGMGRLGLSGDEILALLRAPIFQDRLRAEGLMTHLADADNADPSFTHDQVHRFRVLLDRVKAAGFAVPLVHAANSAAILFHPFAHFNVVRPGLMLYGYHTAAHARDAVDLRPVLSLSAKVVQVRTLAAGDSVSYNRQFIAPRPSRIAVLPIGYADGYSRLLSNRGAVLIRGRRAPIVGRVCMDMTMVDVTGIPNVIPGDEAVLIGQQGGLRITAAHLAAWSQTIPYEVLCAIGPRVHRVYRS
ncbi:alanine racemase [Candidatus Nitrospira bockiana]